MNYREVVIGRALKILVGGGVTLVAALVLGGHWLKGRIGSPVEIVIGPETTILSGPLRADGSVDFVAAINEKLSRGVTAGNNALVGMLPAIGTSEETLGPKWREVVRMCGGQEAEGCWHMQPKIAEGTKYWELDSEAWKAGEHPEIEGWLKENEGAMAIIGAAVERERFWFPMVATAADGSIASVDIENHLGKYGALRRQIGEAFRYRAMLRLGERDAAGAWKDIRAAHRFGHLQAQEARLIDGLIGVNQASAATRGDMALLRSGLAEKPLLEKMLRDLGELPPLPISGEIWQRCEIYEFSDAIQNMSRDMQAADARMTPGFPAPDWNRMLRMGNGFFREYCAVHHWSNAGERSAWRGKMRKVVDDRNEKMKKMNTWSDAGLGGYKAPLPKAMESQASYSDRLATYMLCLMTPQLPEIEDSAKNLEMISVAIALEIYRIDHSVYPDSLGSLAPAYMAEVPRDFFGEALGYSHGGASFKIVSAGPGGREAGMVVEITHEK